MNIAFVFHCPIVPYVGGVQMVTDLLAKTFVNRSHKVVFICTDIRKKDYDYVDYSAPQYYLDISKTQEEYVADYLKILNDNNIQIVISQETRTDSLLLLENTPSAVKKISVVHINPYGIVNNEKRIKRGLHTKRISSLLAKYLVLAFPNIARGRYIRKEKLLYRRLFAVSDKLVFLSKSSVEIVKQYDTTLLPQKLTAIGNPNAPLSKQTLREKENLIICVARLSEIPKNIRDFIDVWESLCKRNPTWRAEIIGDGPDRDFLERYAERTNVENLKFIGVVKNVTDYYQRAKFVCLTSIYEGWGMVLTEGMSYGCVPCVYGSYGAAFDIVDDGVNGIISTPFRPKEMADRIQTLINDESRLVQMSSSAIEKVKDFNADKIADKWDALFGSLEE